MTLMDRARNSEPRGDEKFFFTPGDLGILICYDRHFPEAARVLGLS
jgi:predicted amidohydrolase